MVLAAPEAMRLSIAWSAAVTVMAGRLAVMDKAFIENGERPPADAKPRGITATSSKAKKKTVRIASGRKRTRQNVKLNAANTALRTRFRTVIKNVQKAVAAGDKAKAAELFKTAQPVIDSVADKGLFHKNKAARHKSRLSAKVKALATAA